MTHSSLIWPPTPNHIHTAATLLRQGEVVGIPTETVYGLAADVFQPTALLKIFQTKERPMFDPLIVHVPFHPKPDLAWLSTLGLVQAELIPAQVRPTLERLLQAVWPGPLTIVLPRQNGVPDIATSGLPTVAIRMPAHPVAQALLAAVQTPLAAPSANRFGHISPTSAQAVLDELGGRISGVLDGGPCQVGIESSILALTPQGTWQLLRPGQWSANDLEPLLEAPVSRGVTITEQPQAPGMLLQHYAPHKQLYLLPDSLEVVIKRPKPQSHFRTEMIGLLLMKHRSESTINAFGDWCGRRFHVEYLSPHGNPVEIAQHLFERLRALDQSQAPILWAEPCENTDGLLGAVADRLQRASQGILAV